MSTENADRSAAASEQPTKARSLSWSLTTIASVLLCLASAGLMTVAMFWVGAYYRGPQISRGKEGRQKLQELRAAEQLELHTYGWINRTDDVVRIPVEQAMQLLTQEAESQENLPPTPRGN